MKISLNKKKLTDIAFIVPSLAGVSIFVLIPFIDVLRRSFTNVSGTQFVFFSNYITIFQNAAFRLAFSNTIKFMVICIPILMIFSLRPPQYSPDSPALFALQFAKRTRIIPTTALNMPTAVA